ncbi:MAG: phosphomannomutase/phosphoglucomutase [Candidatus Riflebacteria bacterium]|nr:phosphomannomutase/phosphoglucomutase [Candidatus Riflebacteria bacterium]
MKILNPHLFKEYDVRGVVEHDLPRELVVAIGRAFATYVIRKSGKHLPRLAVGRDVRLSSPALHDAIIEGMTATGANVTDLGECPTPVTYFALFHLPVDGAIMITGSHNPKEFNGFKLCFNRTTLFGDQIQEVRRLIEADDFVSGAGKTDSYNILDAYHTHQMKRHADLKEFDKPLSVVVDAGNGTAALGIPRLLRELGCKVEELFCTVDGAFPNHHPDPTIPANLDALIKTVHNIGADIGLAFDGDADRLGIVDENGRILWGDEIMVVLARDILKRHPGATVIGEVKCSQRMYDAINAAGGRAIMWKTGHSLIKNKMKEEHALLAGEMSGHLFFSEDYFGFDDAAHAALEVIRILYQHKSSGGKGLSELLSDLPAVVATPEIRIDCPDAHKSGIVEDVRSSIAAHQKTGNNPRIRELILVDGIRAIFEKGWGLVRSSNTQPILVSRYEALDADSLDEYQKFMEKHIDLAKKRRL